MEISQIIREYFETFKWILLALSIILFFKKPITRLIDRIKKINPKTGDFELEQIKKQDKSLDTKEEQNKFEKEYNELMEEFYKTKASEIEYKLKYEVLKKEKPAEIEKELRETQIELSMKNEIIKFEKIYNIILNSQIELLKFLSAYAEGANQATVNSFFINTGLSERFKIWNLNNFLSYLLAKELITYSDNNYKTTERGELFLKYLKLSEYTGKEKIL